VGFGGPQTLKSVHLVSKSLRRGRLGQSVYCSRHPHGEPASIGVDRLLDVAASPAASRIKIAEGDVFKDPIPESNDALILGNIVHLFGPERNLEILRRLRARVREGARLLIVDFWTDPTHAEPVFAALMAREFLINTGEGDVYSDQEARGWFQETGWRFVGRKPLAGPQSLVVAEAAK
jgi:O-methyltransferase